MSAAMSDNEIRAAVVSMLETKGYKVTDTSSGSGVPRYSRLTLERGAEKMSVAVKKASSPKGRVSFTRDSDGTFLVLRDVDRVVCAKMDIGSPGQLRVTMFDKKTLVAAFEANHRAKVAHNMEHIPMWVNPDFEDGWKLAGSGFQGEAIWSETIDISPIASHKPVPLAPTPSPAGSEENGIMGRIKAMLSEHMGVSPELIEIDVRVKI